MRRGDRAARRGLVLLEVIVALAILAGGGISLVTLAASSLAAIDRATQADDASRAASHFLDAVTLWTRADLDRHLGVRAEGPWRLRIERPMPSLYVVSLRDSATDRTSFTTSLFRAEATHEGP